MFRTPDESRDFFERAQRRSRAWTCPHGRALLVGAGVKPGREFCLCDPAPTRSSEGPIVVSPLQRAIARAQKGAAPEVASGA